MVERCTSQCKISGLGTFFDCLPKPKELLEEFQIQQELEDVQGEVNTWCSTHEYTLIMKCFETARRKVSPSNFIYVNTDIEKIFEPIRTTGWEHVVISKSTFGHVDDNQKRNMESNTTTSGFQKASTLLEVDKHSGEKKLRLGTTSTTETDNAIPDKNKDECERLYEQFDKTLTKDVIRTVLSVKLKGSFSVQEKDIVGLQSVKKLIKERVIYPIKRPELHRGLCEPPRGILLFGSPGTGKTMLAKWIATESNASFFIVTPSVLLSKFYGETEMSIKALFLVAREYAPSILFFDEVDALMGQRQNNEQDANIRMKNELLQCMDGTMTESSTLIMLIGATNRPEALDQAAIRRFGRRIMVCLPELQTRKDHIRQLLNYHRKATNCVSEETLSDEQVEGIAAQLGGWSAFDIKSLCMKAADYPYQDALTTHGGIMSIPSTATFRPIRYTDFLLALRDVKPSSTEEEEQRLKVWQQLFGSS